MTFPADHVRPDFRNKAGLFRITVKEVKERVLPALDDDFAKDVGSFQSLAELREEAAKAEAASRVAVRAAWTVGAVGAAAASLMVGYGIAAL